MMNRRNTFPVVLALIGIAIELLAIFLLSQKRITMTIAGPMIVAGMFLAFVPIFVVARRARR